MADIRRIDDRISVSPQIQPEDVPALAAAGFTAIVNNRPDGEDAAQPSGESIEQAARAAGMAYSYIPVTHAGFSGAQIAAMAGALNAAPGPVFAFCRSGTRSTNLWALARAQAGDAPGDLVKKAALAGYDISGIAPLLETLAGGA